MGGVKNKYRSNMYHYATTFHCLISLETVITQKSEVFPLRISLRNVNESIVTCRYPQIYNFSFRKEYLETLCKCIYLGF